MEQLLCQKSVYDALKYYLGRHLPRYWDRAVLVADVKKSYLHSIKVKSFESACISIIRTSADCVIATCNGSVDWIDADVRNLCHYWPLCALRDQSANDILGLSFSGEQRSSVTAIRSLLLSASQFQQLAEELACNTRKNSNAFGRTVWMLYE